MAGNWFDDVIADLSEIRERAGSPGYPNRQMAGDAVRQLAGDVSKLAEAVADLASLMRDKLAEAARRE